MQAVLPFPVICIVRTITKAGFSCEIVGGAVRDLLLGKESHDWDFATNATPEQILPLFTESFYENAFGTVMVAQKHLRAQFNFPAQTDDEESDNLIYDITTYRSDGLYRNNRHPETVTWGKSIEEDLKRRDFTVNAIALRITSDLEKISADKLQCDLIDPFKGQLDLIAKQIRTVGDPDARLSEDALRMLRAVRFCVQLGMQLEAQTEISIKKHAQLLTNISWERISEEFMKMIGSDAPDQAILMMDELGLLPYVLPELIEAKGVKQSGHHIYDVWEHCIRALGTCPSKDPVVRLATLLHDIAKPQTARQTARGTVTFYSHEVVGARIAKKVAVRLRLSKKDCDRIFTLVRWHMFTYEKYVTDAYIRRFIRRIGVENIDAMMALRTGDRVGSGSKANSWRLDELRQRIYNEQHQPLKITDMIVNGKDVMEVLKIQPGPLVGEVLSKLFEEVLEDPTKNDREYLLKKIETLGARKQSTQK